MLKLINGFLNKTTMYKVLTYGLFLLSIQGIVLSAVGLLPFDFIWMVLSLVVINFSCYFLNELIAKLLRVPTNIESALITSLILFLIIQPASSFTELVALFLISLLAMASKYIFVADKMHLFNPAAVAAVLGALFLNYYATWWVGSTSMLPLVLIVGALIIKKVRRFQLVSAFIVTAIISAFISNFGPDVNYINLLIQILTAWPIIFFATIMLTEPLTMPGTKNLQIAYAVFVGLLFGMRFNIGPIYSAPELALIIGNIAFFVIKPRNKFILTLLEKNKLSSDIYEFVFSPNKKLSFKSGQYIEWTLPHNNPDSRGNRRFFTIASSPTEDNVKLGVRMNNPGSSLKNHLRELEKGDHISAAQIAGDFILDLSKPAVFISGGIGITPFRSMIKNLIDTNNKHKVDLFYFVKSADDFVYKDIFNEATQKINVKVNYIVSDNSTDLRKLIKDNVEEFEGREYYLSGPNAMVDSYKKILNDMGIHRDQFVTDYFPGF